MPNQMPIPDDWSEEENGWALGLICFPNSDKWRRAVRGSIYSLTRGRNWDFDTGQALPAMALGERIYYSFMACDIQELIDEMKNLVRVGRMINASLHGESINFDSEPALPNAINYEGIGPILKGLSAKIDSDLTLDQMIALMEAQDDETYGFKDWLEILLLLKEIFPDAGSLPFGAIGSLWSKITAARMAHNTLSIQAMQATYLRGIQNAISPTKDDVTEETFVKGLWDTAQKMPWLSTAIIALVDPSPTGESVLVVKIASIAKTVVTGLFSWLPNWWNSYINSVGNPQPQGTVVGMLSEISRKIQSLTDEQETPTVTVSNRLKLIADAIEGIETSSTDQTPALEAIAQAILAIDLPEGVTWVDIFTSLEEKIGDSVPIINVTCNSCGSSNGCGCGSGSGSGAYGPGVNGPTDDPPITIVSGQIPVGFPGTTEYQDYKCKAANVLILNLAELLAQMSGFENTNLEQFTLFNNALGWIAGKITVFGASLGGISADATTWLADKIMLFLWPYPNAAHTGLGIFDDVRLSLLENREGAVCELFNSYNTSEARSNIEARIDGYIDDTSFTGEVKDLAKEMYKALLSNEWLNRLFEKDSFINNYSDASAIDCSLCEGEVIAYVDFYPCEPEVSNGTGHFTDGGIVTVTSCVANLAGADRHSVIVQASPYESGILRTITCSNLTTGSYSLNWTESVGGPVLHIEGDHNFFEDYAKDCVSWNLIRFADLLTQFTVTIQADVIIE